MSTPSPPRHTPTGVTVALLLTSALFMLPAKAAGPGATGPGATGTGIAESKIPAATAVSTPYAGQEQRDIKALSSAEMADLLAGKGMGFAKAAELNGYPGPAHVLELTRQLHLTETQEAQTRALHARMEAAARSAGAEVVEAERALDDLFRQRNATPEKLAQALDRVAQAYAKVRGAHLQAHLEQTALLTKDQVSSYNRLRGYGGSPNHPNSHTPPHAGHHHGH